MKLNKISLLLALVLLLSFTFVSSAGYIATETNLTIVSPASNSAIAGTALVINCSMRQDVNMNYTLAYFYAKSTSTANSSWSRIGTGYNNTIWDFNGTINTASVEDANNYVFNCSITNGTSWITKTATGITVDNTIPTAPSALTPTSDTDGDVSFSATVVGRETTGCTLFFDGVNPGESSYTMTHSGNTCSRDLTAIPEQSYTWYVRATDSSNTTNSATQTTTVDIKTSSGKATVMIAEQGVESAGGSLLSITKPGTLVRNNWIIVIVVVAIIAVIIAKRR